MINKRTLSLLNIQILMIFRYIGWIFFTITPALYIYVIETKFTKICMLGYGCFATYKHVGEYIG